MGANPDLFENARIYKVYYKLGKFATGDPKCYPAPFHLLRNSEGQFIETESMGDISNRALTYSLDDEVQRQSRAGNGWVQVGDDLILDMSELGDPQGNPDDWRGVHFFGLL